MAIRVLATADIESLTPVLKHAFSKDPELRWVIPRESDWDRIAEPFFTMMLAQALAGGHGLTDDAMRGVSLWEPPGRTTSFFSQLWALCRMVYMLRSNFARAMRVQSYVEKCRPRRPHWYLAYIATDPQHQRNGIGSELLRPILEMADSELTPVYLECSNASNIPFYRAHGFHLVDSISLPDGPGIWPMIREVR